MKTGVTIRPCRLNECAIILNLWKETEVTPSISDDIDTLEMLVNENSELFLVAEHNGQVVGSVVGGWDGWRGGIYRLAVSPEYRRQGIGKALVQEVEHRLSARGARKISVLVEYRDALAMSFWHSLGASGYERDTRMIRYVKTL
jgi:ribosomal protein S18 acetylase RimI-like enzyme